ncbi:hypothetical protein BT93_L0804 [Corymbia citriodora subsp. variegata]|uniref:F-box domain-containing protein n=1 Tax=Corymbia citriodora subsp. variegata TaxID=360336 RepID=A0A8T0CU05_CORYI|nr:hypothetical protein BT93_L0804 [Corymbia citriodora subsp. variegata]
MTSSLALDLLCNVLSRLPTISLLQLRPVCREWRDIIDNLHSVTMHATSSGIENIASCHRLLCFDDPQATYLLNPLTRKIIPVSSGSPRQPWWRHWHSIAIGLDHLIGRYNILCEIISTRAEILNQGSWSWRDMASVPSCLRVGGPMFPARSIH